MPLIGFPLRLPVPRRRDPRCWRAPGGPGTRSRHLQFRALGIQGRGRRRPGPEHPAGDGDPGRSTALTERRYRLCTDRPDRGGAGGVARRPIRPRCGWRKRSLRTATRFRRRQHSRVIPDAAPGGDPVRRRKRGILEILLAASLRREWPKNLQAERLVAARRRNRMQPGRRRAHAPCIQANG